MILFISNSGESLPIVYRLRKEGVEAHIYLHSPAYRNNYQGIIERTPLSRVRQIAHKASMVVFDITRPNEKARQDIALLKAFSLKTGTPFVFGAVADRLKKYTKVIGAARATANIEMDRGAGSRIAQQAGLQIPETHDFNALNEGIAFLKSSKDLWVFKPYDNQDLDLTYVEKFSGELLSKMQCEYRNRCKGKYMLQKVIQGAEISTEGWFDGNKWVHFNHTVEDKRLMNFGLGPAIGSQNNTVWIKKKKGLLTVEFERLTSFLENCGYIGPIDINCIVSEKDHKPYFLEFSPRLGWDAFYCLATLVKGPLATFFENDFKVSFHEGFASSARITIPPFPYADRKLLTEFAKDVLIKNPLPSFWMEDIYFNRGIRCAGSDGILGVVAERGNSIGGSVGNVYRTINKLKIGSYLQYRTDLGRRAEKVVKKLKQWGITYE